MSPCTLPGSIAVYMVTWLIGYSINSVNLDKNNPKKLSQIALNNKEVHFPM